MELLLENVRNSILGKFSKKPKEALWAGAGQYAGIAVIIISSFLLGRAALFYAVFPCGIALITVLMHKSKANIYTLPLILLEDCLQTMGQAMIYGGTLWQLSSAA